MPPFPGEERLVTVYADIHYYFSQPTIRPILHRFDKASYFYIYYNSTRQTTRLEVANNPSTAEQDAFNGYLDNCHVVNSYKFPTLVTIVVDPTGSSPTSPSSPRSSKDPNEWRLANTDPRDQGKHMYRLHTLDVYFWAQEDAKQVTDVLQRYMNPSQLDIVELDDKQTDQVDPVVQNLEDVAISDPAYRNGQTRNAQGRPQSTGTNPPPPPPPQPHSHLAQSPSPGSQASYRGTPISNKAAEKSENYVPLAYNPAAPPAPEPIAHREDTPPPVDGPAGTGLAAAAMEPYTPGMPQSAPYTGVASPIPVAFSHYGSPPSQSATQPSTNAPSSFSFAPPPTYITSPPSSTAPQQPRHPGSTAEQTYAPPPSQDQHAQTETPSADFYPTQHASLSHVQPQYADYLSSRPQAQGQAQQPAQAPVGGYSNYSYENNLQQQAQYRPQPQQQYQQQHFAGESPYNVHQQLYRPTEHEHEHSHSHGGKQQSQHRPSSSSAGGGGKPSRVDSVADKAEKKAGKLWKKIQNF